MTTRSGTAWVFWSETEVREKRDRVRGEGLCCLQLCVAGTCCLAAPDCSIIDSGDTHSLSCSVMSYSSATPQTVARQAPLSMGFSRQEYWSGLPIPSPGNLPDPRIEPGSPTLQADSLPSELSFIEFLLCAKLSIYVIFHLTIHMTISKMRTRKLRNSADVIKVIYLRGQAGIQA